MVAVLESTKLMFTPLLIVDVVEVAVLDGWVVVLEEDGVVVFPVKSWTFCPDGMVFLSTFVGPEDVELPIV